MGSDVVYDHLSSRNTKFGVIRMWVYAIAKTMGMIEFTSKKSIKKQERGQQQCRPLMVGGAEEGQPLKGTEKGGQN